MVGKEPVQRLFDAALGAVTVLIMCVVLAVIYRESGPFPDNFNFSLFLSTFSMSYLLHKTQKGTIQ